MHLGHELMHQVIAYTDGGASGNPGPGGFGVVLMSGNHHKEISRAYRLTTNNRMELLGVIVALESLRHPGTHIAFHSDSKYVVDAVTKGWLNSWVKKGFKDKKNPDLWKRYLQAAQAHVVTFQWVKGHAGDRWNERADQLAVMAYKEGVLEVDEGYERSVGSRK
jgi:ribonuclease HI